MSDQPELLPCPFCGSAAEFWSGGTAEFYGHDHQGMSIDCNKCGMTLALDTCMDKNGETSKGYEFGCSCCNDISSILHARWNTRAPAEDVRAVGEEPVGKVLSESEMGIGYGRKFGRVIWFGPQEPGLLYRHPQRPVAPQCSEVTSQCSEHLRTQGRPVVLPERRKSDGWLDITSQDRGWNACIDEFERLNK